jgi:two-component system phosphate regulon sensor histidine kinase PhoR
MAGGGKDDSLSLHEKSLGKEQVIKYAQDFADTYRAEKARRREVELAYDKMRAVVDSMVEGMLAADENFIIIEANNALCLLINKRKEDILNHNMFEIFDIPGFKDRLGRIVELDKRKDKIELDMKDSVGRVFNVSVSRLKGEMGFVMIFYDITSWKRSENLKGEFISILSHELRTPLGGIIGFSELLAEELEGGIDKEQMEMIEGITSSGYKMSEIVNELLDFASLQSSAIDSMDEKVHVSDIIEDVITITADKSDSNNIRIDLEKDDGQFIVTGNGMMLKELFCQVVDNSVVFGKRGGRILIRIEEKAGHCVITVSDDGIGIPGSDLERVFDSFYQVEEHSTRSRDGLGLGLALAKHITELHGGMIRLDSSMGKWTRCELRLPVKEGLSG